MKTPWKDFFFQLNNGSYSYIPIEELEYHEDNLERGDCITMLYTDVKDPTLSTLESTPDDFGPILDVNITALDALTKDKRVEAIDDAIHRLQFERRVTLLTDAQRKSMMDEQVSPEVHARIEACETQLERDAYIAGTARAVYFRRMAWIAYLNGESDTCPPSPK